MIRSKNYIFHTGKENNHTNDVDVSNALCSAAPIALRSKNIPTTVAAMVVMISSSPIGFSATVKATVGPSSIGFFNVFMTTKTTHLSYIFYYSI